MARFTDVKWHPTGLALLVLAAASPALADPPDVVWQTAGHATQVWSVAVSPDGLLLASGGEDQLIKLWQLADGTLLRTLPTQTRSVKSVAFSPDSQILASGSSTTIKLWRVADGAELRTIDAHRGGVLSVAFSPDGQLLASAGSPGDPYDALKLWRVTDGSLVNTLVHTSYYWTAVAFSADGQKLAAGGSMYGIPHYTQDSLWSVSDGQLLWVAGVASSGNPTSVDLSPDGQYMASDETPHGIVAIRRTADGTMVQQPPEARANSVAFKFDGQELVTGCQLPFIKRWQVPGGTLIKSYDMPSRILSVKYTPNGRLIAFGSGSGLVGVIRRVVVKKGDVNCDALVDFGDINPFVLALSDPQEYERQYPACDIANADIDNNGQVDFGDINPFVELLSK